MKYHERKEVHDTYNKSKLLAEKRHLKVCNLLKKELKHCKITYAGDKGLDVEVKFNGYRTLIEIKTCEAIIRAGINRKKSSGRLLVDLPSRLGRFKFDCENRKPYQLSQHHDLVAYDGWYIFVVANCPNIIFGCKANTFDFNGRWKMRRLSWHTVLQKCSPDWLQQLKYDVYTKQV